VRTERDAAEADRILAPVASIAAGAPIDAEHRLRVLRAVIAAQMEDRIRRTSAETNTVEDCNRAIAQSSHAVL
jgi:hypothetical protein